MQGFLLNVLCVVLLSTTIFWSKEAKGTLLNAQPILSDLTHPWSIKTDKFGRYWITLMSGDLVVVENDERQDLALDLDNLYRAGQGGLLDIVLVEVHLNHIRAIVSYAQGNAHANRLALKRLELSRTDSQWQVTQMQTLFTIKHDKNTPVHYAGRLLLLPDNTLLVNSGDGFDNREDAQRPESQLGKTLRMNLDGSPVTDAPFADAPYLFSLGHRNAQGLALDDQGRIWQHEHGPAGGDEVNLLESGANYGWPIVTLGKDYSGALISPIQQARGMTGPKVNWTPSIAPSSMVFYASDAIPDVTGHLLIGTLKTKTIHAIDIHNEYRERILTLPFSERIRDITIDSQGQLLVLTDGEHAKVYMLSEGQG